MMHGKQGRKLGVKTAHRKAMMANMCSSLILNKRIETTLMRAKELRRMADRMITLGKRQTIHARRQALKVLRNPKAVKVVFDDLSSLFSDRMGGYTRILKLGFRRGDSAPMAVIEYIVPGIGDEFAPKKAAKKEQGKGKKSKAKAEAKVEKKPESKTKAKKKAAATKKKAAPKKATKKAEKKTAKKATTKKVKGKKPAKGGSASGGK